MADRQKLVDLTGWVGNVSTSVLIVFVNKIVMSSTRGYGFHYATTLTAIHFLVCSASIWLTQGLGLMKRTTMPKKDLMIFAVVADISILTLNLSLMINTVSFYQVAKLLIIPFVCFLERFYMGRVFTREVAVAILLVICGVGVVTLEDLRMDITPAGLMVAAVSVVSSGLQQIFVRSLQQKHRLSAHELLSNTAPVQAWTLLLAGPLIDRVVTTEWVTSYHVTPAAVLWLTISALLAVLVNVSQFMCLGRFSAVSFQVLGHSKTVLVLLGSWLFLGDLISTRKLLGMSLAVAGMVWYGSASASAASSAVPRRPSSPRISALVEKDGDLPGDRAYAEARVGVPLDGGGKRDVV